MPATASIQLERILLVEDSPSDAALVREMLTLENRFELMHVSSLEEALNHPELATAACIVLDLSLPDASGLDAVRAFGTRTPLVVLSGTQDARLALDSVRAGAQDYLTKDRVNAEAFHRVVSYAISRKEIESTLQERATQQATVAQLGSYAIAEADAHAVTARAAEAVGSMLALPPDEVLRAVAGADHPYEALSRYARRNRELTVDQENFLQAVANVVAGAVKRDADEEARLEAEQLNDRLQAALHQAQKLDSVGQLAGGIAHDFNNLLSVILNYTGFVAAELGEDSPLADDVEEIRRAAERAASLTRQLLVFSRHEVLAREVLELNEVVRDIEKLLRRTLDAHVELVVRLDPDVPPIRADRSQLEQVLMNLAINARDAMPEGGELVIETQAVELDETYASFHKDAVAGRYVRLAVSDTGCGMPSEVQERAFDPFFTTKPTDEGTGLGLSTVWGIVKQGGGMIGLYSEPGQGTVVKVHLPAADAAAPAPARRGGERLPAASGGVVLVVEDADPVRTLTARILRAAGFDVLEAPDGERALEVVADHPAPIDLLVTDVVMPRMSGRELAEAIQRLRGELPVVYVSGYTDARLGLDRAILVEKPFTAYSLLSAVQRALDAGRTSVAGVS